MAENPGNPPAREGGTDGGDGAAAALSPQVRGELERRVERSGKAMEEDDVHVVQPTMLKRAVGASAIGNCMEWFDFGVYSYLAATIGKVFFPDASPAAQVISSFATFAAAFVVRPLGGLFFGPLGDRIGRQKVLATTMLLMAFGTFMIGFIPSYAAIGIVAPGLLLFARMLQGFSTGGEYGGATTFVAEYAPDRRRGFLGSFLDLGTFFGYAFGSAFVTVLEFTLDDAQMMSWGWRVPFWFAGPLGIVGLYLRLKLEDSPAFQGKLDEQENSSGGGGGLRELRDVVTRQWRPLLVCVGLVLLYNVTNYMVTGYLPTYQTENLGRSSTAADVLVLCGMLWIVVTIVFVGRLSDLVGRRAVYRWAAVGQIVLAVPAFELLRQDGWLLPLIGVLILSTLLAGFAGPSAATLPALFPTTIRYAAMGIGFNFSVAAFGGSTPLITQSLVSATGFTLLPGFYLVASGCIGLVAVAFLKESAGVPLRGSPPMVESEQEARRLAAASGELLRAR
ncbi:MFS transporter [Streptomyces xiaopingdaonensis]|uniref:MFS transporter n=1 Tax=Streptomyces xiaopingdaonensis TaxID=1565415 RepID=UPI00035C7476|nr:MFS transporter [Streptomyces xiaopingdaonensis]